MFLDLPALSVNISALSGINAQCEPLTFSSSANELLSHIFPNLTNIVPSAKIGAGLNADANLKIPPELATRISAVALNTATTLIETDFPLETACLSWDSKATMFVKPTFSVTTTDAAAGPTDTGSATESDASGKKNLGVRLYDCNPFAQTASAFWAAAVVISYISVLAAF